MQKMLPFAAASLALALATAPALAQSAPAAAENGKTEMKAPSHPAHKKTVAKTRDVHAKSVAKAEAKGGAEPAVEPGK